MDTTTTIQKYLKHYSIKQLIYPHQNLKTQARNLAITLNRKIVNLHGTGWEAHPDHTRPYANTTHIWVKTSRIWQPPRILPTRIYKNYATRFDLLTPKPSLETPKTTWTHVIDLQAIKHMIEQISTLRLASGLDFSFLDKAACAQTDPDIFFPSKETPDQSVAAIHTCISCPVRLECQKTMWKQEIKLGTSVLHGVYGGIPASVRSKIIAPIVNRKLLQTYKQELALGVTRNSNGKLIKLEEKQKQYRRKEIPRIEKLIPELEKQAKQAKTDFDKWIRANTGYYKK